MRVQKAEQESFPLQLYRKGRTAQQLSDETGISLGRIQSRLRAAKLFLETHPLEMPNVGRLFRVH